MKKLMICGLKILVWFFAILVLVSAFAVGQDIAYKEQYEYIKSIQLVSTIIFGISGAWLAISFPKATGSAKEAVKATGEKIRTRLDNAIEDIDVLIGFVRTMIASVLVIVVSIAIPFLREVLLYVDISAGVTIILKGVLFSTIVALSFAQLCILFWTLFSCKRSMNEINRELGQAKVLAERENNSKH
ncbi:hypothetical protein AB6D81_20680 [Vibrio splendidus]|uniref:hypothetical protein n=1 Tax=Vibrio splendidus TaxID=29497 RepID=UPI000D3A03AB|nr:hypothetical protein [Vibrio splendidus]PTO88267.1 hypothetical protein CWO29_15195 [Vibrio splendidus]